MLGSCSGSGNLQPSPNGPAAAGTFDMPFPAGDAAPGLRHVQQGGSYTFTEDDVLFSKGVAFTGGAFQLQPAPVSHLMFGINVGTALPATLTVSGELSGVFIGLANYAEQRWEWRGPFDSAQEIDLLAGKYLSPAGGAYYAVATASPSFGEINASVDVQPVDFTGSWNVLFWFAADNYLAPAAYEAIQDLESIGSSSDINILAGYDINPDFLHSWELGAEQVQFIKVVQDFNLSVINTAGDAANQSFDREGYYSAYTANVVQFVDWAGSNFPADHTALVLFGFGDGWRTWGTGDEREPVDHSISGILADHTEGNGVLGSNNALATALSSHHFDLLVFDASHMGHIEALYEYKDIADWVTASQIVVPGAGWPYSTWLEEWQAGFPLPAGAVGVGLLEAVDGQYGSQDLPFYTNNLYNMARLDGLVDELVAFKDDTATWPAIVYPEITQAMVMTRNGGNTSYGTLDLPLFMRNLRSISSVNDIRLRCGSVLAAYERFTTTGRQSDVLTVCGLSIYLPGEEWFIQPRQIEYEALAFNQATGWLELLQSIEVPETLTITNWQPGWRIVVDYGSASVDAELEAYDPDDNYGRPTYTDELAGVLQFSADNVAAAATTESAELLPDTATGSYSFNAWHRGTEPAELAFTAWLEDDAQQQVLDLGSFTVEAGGRTNIAALQLIDYGVPAGDIIEGDRIELQWTDFLLKPDLRVRDAELRLGGVTFPEGYAGDNDLWPGQRYQLRTARMGLGPESTAWAVAGTGRRGGYHYRFPRWWQCRCMGACLRLE